MILLKIIETILRFCFFGLISFSCFIIYISCIELKRALNYETDNEKEVRSNLISLFLSILAVIVFMFLYYLGECNDWFLYTGYITDYPY